MSVLIWSILLWQLQVSLLCNDAKSPPHIPAWDAKVKPDGMQLCVLSFGLMVHDFRLLVLQLHNTAIAHQLNSEPEHGLECRL